MYLHERKRIFRGCMKSCTLTIVLAAAAIDGVMDEVEIQEARTLVYGLGFSEQEIDKERRMLQELPGPAYMARILEAVYAAPDQLTHPELRKTFDTVFTMIMADGSVTSQEQAFYRLLNDVWSISRA